MNIKNFSITVAAMFFAHMMLSFVLHTSVLPWSDYPGSIPEAEISAMGMPAILVGALIWCVMFLYVFSKNYEGKGITEGMKFGLIVGLFFHLPYLLFYFANFQFTTELLLGQFFGETIINVVIGAIAAMLFKPKV